MSHKPINTGNCPKNWPMPIYGLLDIFGTYRSTQLNVIIFKTFSGNGKVDADMIMINANHVAHMKRVDF